MAGPTRADALRTSLPAPAGRRPLCRAGRRGGQDRTAAPRVDSTGAAAGWDALTSGVDRQQIGGRHDRPELLAYVERIARCIHVLFEGVTRRLTGRGRRWWLARRTNRPSSGSGPSSFDSGLRTAHARRSRRTVTGAPSARKGPSSSSSAWESGGDDNPPGRAAAGRRSLTPPCASGDFIPLIV